MCAVTWIHIMPITGLDYDYCIYNKSRYANYVHAAPQGGGAAGRQLPQAQATSHPILFLARFIGLTNPNGARGRASNP